jgi:NifB/MoaA-like Fe-S oxidoreductase
MASDWCFRHKTRRCSNTALEPGKMFLVDMNEGRIIDDEIKDAIVTKRPYRKWLDDNLLHLAKNIHIIQRH